MKQLLETLLREFRVTHAMAIQRGDIYECAMLFKTGTSMTTVMQAERHLIQSGVGWSSFHILRDRPCVTWQMLVEKLQEVGK